MLKIYFSDSTDEDARQAFERNNRPLKQVQIKLALSSRTEMQKVIEEARTKPFLQSVQQVTQLTQSLNNKIVPAAPQAPVITSTQKDKQSSPRREDLKDKDTRSRNRDRDDSKSRDRDDSKNRRDRSRRRTKSRSRSRERRDRSRDRRDRRRRDRSRSKDRRDSRDNRRRDNRRSKSRERDRSRDRDGRRSSDRRRSDLKTNEVIEIKDDVPNSAPRVWEQKPNMPNDLGMQPGGILGNFPGQNIDDARRNLGILTVGMQNNLGGNQMNRFPRNDPNISPQGDRDNNWQHRKGRFHEGNNEHISPLLNQFPHGMRPNMMGNLGGDMRPHMFQHNQHGMRMPFNHNQDNGFNLNRPFLARPGTVFPDNFRSQDHAHQFGMQQDRNDDFRNKRHDNIENCCIQIRPYFGGYGEIRKFFGGIFISNTGVKFVMNEFGKKTGIVYIKFVRSEGKEQALQRSGFMLRGVPVEVKHLDDEDWERCGSDNINTEDDLNDTRNEEERNSPRSESKQISSSFTHAVVDDIPEFVKEHDILKMFSNYEILSVHIAINKQYRHLAYVQFNKEEDLRSALADKTSHVISGKPVTVRPISEETFKEVERKHANGELIDTSFDSNLLSSSPRESEFIRNGEESDSHIITDCVVLNGLPPKTTDRDVLDFFSDIGIVPLKIHIMHTQFGPSGDAYCEFKSCEDAIGALDKNDMPLGAGTIRVELVYRRDMDRALGIPAGPPLLAQPMPGPRFPPNRFAPRGPNMLGPRVPPHMMRRRPPPNMNMRYDGPVDGMGPQGCVVSMENVPFKAGVHEILEFFDGFELEGHNVFRRFNDNGAPTGDARVTFNTADQARRAVEECNRLRIRERTIFLRQL